MHRVAGFAVLALIVAGPAAAQTPPSPPPGPPAPAPRFAFTPVEGGALKMDTQTGMVSLCGKGAGGFACEAVPDSRDAYEAEIARLQAEIADLRRSVPLPPDGVPPSAPGAGTTTSPDEFDKALDYAERAFRRLKGLIDGLRQPQTGDKT